MNKRNFKKVLNQITKHPETWNQENWHCGTTHCLFGWAQIFSNGYEDTDSVKLDGKIFLGLNDVEADYLSNSERTLKDFQMFYKGDLSRYIAWLESHY